MKTLERIKDRIKEFNAPVIVISLFLIVLQSATLTIVFYHKNFIFFKDIPDLYDAPSLKKSCYLAMRSILQKKASSLLFDENLVLQMEDGNYKFFDFVGEEKIFDVIKSKSKGNCTVIITDRLGDRFFTFRFKDSDRKKHIYGRYIDEIHELTSDELTEE